MERARHIAIAAALALLAASSAQAATPEALAHYRATLKRIAVDQKEARALCRSLSGQPRRVCFAEADADAKKATAAAEADVRDTPRARRNAKLRRKRYQSHANLRFMVVLAILFAIGIALVLTIWHEVQKVFGL